MKVDLTFGFQISNFKKGFYPGESTAENGLGDATMRVLGMGMAAGAKRGAKEPTRRKT